LLEQAHGVASDRSGYCDEFDRIDAPFATFELGDEGLRLAEFVRQFLLNHARILSRVFQQGEKAGVIGGVKGLAHAPPGEEARRKLILKPDYPKMG